MAAASLSGSGGRSALVQLDGDWFRLVGTTRELVACHVSEVAPVIAEAEARAAAGSHVAGFVSYEAARAYGLATHEPLDGLPLAAFIVAPELEQFDAHELIPLAAAAPTLHMNPTMDAPSYAAAVGRVRERLAAGDSYQVNLTFQLRGAYSGDPFALFARLARAQRSRCAAYVDFGRFAVCSASPETFFELDGTDIVMRPMKGTAARGRTLAEDRRRAAALRRSSKERAENLMIVDMVRSDLGQIAEVGSVTVPELFRVERFPTVLQMTSTVRAKTDASIAGLFGALFPCASVTGAPKVRTAVLIRDLEAGPRGVYTGAVGYLGPGRKARFNVAIRTATVDRLRSEVSYGIGSGVVWDSRAGREHAECMQKAQVLNRDVAPFALLETLKWTPGEGFWLRDRHLNRMAASARYFGIPFDRAAVRRVLEGCVSGGTPLRVRVLVDEDGKVRAEAAPLPQPLAGRVRVGFAASPIDVSDPFMFHKTTRRDLYERAAASRPDCDEVLLWTPDRHVTETAVGNAALFRDGAWVTPPLAEGLLAGTLRAELLARGAVREGRIGVEELCRGSRVAVFNSVRGWREARFVPRAAHVTECVSSAAGS